jgi:hypothetical protein
MRTDNMAMKIRFVFGLVQLRISGRRESEYCTISMAVPLYRLSIADRVAQEMDGIFGCPLRHSNKINKWSSPNGQAIEVTVDFLSY